MSVDREPYVRAAAEALALDLPEGAAARIAMAFAGLLDMAAAMESVPLAAEEEPLPVFHP